MLLSKANLMPSLVAGTESLACLRVEPDGSTVAANGKVLMAVGPVDESKVHFPLVGDMAVVDRGISLPLDLVEQGTRNLPKDKRVSLQHVALTKNRDARKVELTCSDMRQERRVAGYPRTEPFPDWRAVARRVRSAEPLRVCLNRRDLIELLKGLEAACPDKGDENPVFVEINPEGTGLVLRCLNRETAQRAVGVITAYRTGDQWLPMDEWERKVFAVVSARRLT